MNRRGALKNIGLATSGGILLSNILGACSEDDSSPGQVAYDGRVVVIGAGAAGLFAADLLNENGIDVTILEAGTEIGGRARSLRGFDDFPVELGTDFIYGANSIWSETLEALNLGLVDTGDGFTDNFVFDSSVLDANTISATPGFATSQEFVANIQAYQGGNQAISQGVGEGEIALFSRIIEGQVGNRYGSDITRLGYRSTAEALNLSTSGTEQLVLSGNPIQDILFSRFNSVLDKVQFETIVEQVSYGGEEVVMRTSQGNIMADRVIVTVPLPILKSGAISFTPALPAEKITAMSRMGMDAAIKIFMKFNRNFWGESTRYIYGGQLIPTYINAGIGRSERNRVLLAEVYGADAEALLGLSDAQMAGAIVDELNIIYDGNASQNNSLTEFIVMNWANEPFIQGGFSYQMVGASNDDRIALAQSIEDKVYFAGEATNINGHFGTMQGALESAQKSVEEILQNIMSS